MNMTLATAVPVALLPFLAATHAYAYHPETHEIMSQMALQRSDANRSAPVYDLLGIAYYQAWTEIGIGAVEEDIDPNGAAHFFNPRADKKNGERIGLWSLVNPDATSSPEWILWRDIDCDGRAAGVIGAGLPEPQTHSFIAVQDCYYKALTDPNRNTRTQFALRMFKGLGHVVHHVQDMAQPEHVRLDQHCDVNTCRNWFISKIGQVAPGRPLYKPSSYEARSRFNQNRISALKIPDPVYSKNSTTSIYNVPLDFWTNETNQGLAQFTNIHFTSRFRNFVRCTTNPQKKGYCDVDDRSTVNRFLDSDNPTPLPEPKVSNTTERPVPSSKPGFASEIYIYNDLGIPVAKKGLGALPGTPLPQDEVIWDAYFDKLVPMAIAYSAGFINFHFRGGMELTKSASGTLLLKNLSPADMQGKFELFYDTADGTRTPTGLFWDRTLKPNEQVDLAVGVPAVVTEPKDTFILVFKGKIGPQSAQGVQGAQSTPSKQVDQVAGIKVTLGRGIEECPGIIQGAFGGHRISALNDGKGCYLPPPNSSSKPFQILKPPEHGTLVITAGRFLYTPTQGYTGDDYLQVTYTPIVIWPYEITVKATPQ